MNDVKYKKEIIKIIYYALKENNMDVNLESYIPLKLIIEEYKLLCEEFKKDYDIGELDTFKCASCLLVAINKYRLCSDKRINASIAFDAAYKMCEKPYWYVDDTLVKMEEVDFKKVFETDIYVFDTSKEMIMLSLLYESGAPFNYTQNLEMLYQFALQMKHASETKRGQRKDIDSKKIHVLSLPNNKPQNNKFVR